MSIQSKESNDWKSAFRTEGLDRIGYTKFSKSLTLEFYKEWIEQQYHGEMAYLKRHIPEKEKPQLLLQEVCGSFSVAINYKPHPVPKKLPHLKIASYAQGEDYHHWFLAKLEAVCKKLRTLYPNDQFLPFTDSKPVLERELGYSSGLGWVGKNTCLISQKEGSFFFLGEVYTTLNLKKEPEVLHPDRCGTCTRCIDACPTNAILSPKTLDARKCISYWTIETKEIPNDELKEQIGDHYFGCDICQDVCPWNEKVFGKDNSKKPTQIKDLIEILKSSNSQLKDLFKGTALTRTSSTGHRRNALIVLGNSGNKEGLPVIETFLSHETLGELAKWAKTRIIESNTET